MIRFSDDVTIITFRVRSSRGEMYIGHGRLCVCLSLAAFPHYCTDPDVTWENGRTYPLVVHYWADLQSVHEFRCYDNTAPNAKCQRVLVLALCLVLNAPTLSIKKVRWRYSAGAVGNVSVGLCAGHCWSQQRKNDWNRLTLQEKYLSSDVNIIFFTDERIFTIPTPKNRMEWPTVYAPRTTGKTTSQSLIGNSRRITVCQY